MVEVNDAGAKVGVTQLMVAVWVFFGAAFLFSIARVFIRIKTFRHLLVDDFVFLAALICLLGNAIATTLERPGLYKLTGIIAGVQKPPPTFIEDQERFLKIQLAASLLFWTVLWLVKAAFLTFFRGLTQGMRRHRIAWWVIVVITALAYCGCIISYELACPYFDSRKCQDPWHIKNTFVSFRYSTAVDIITDFLIGVLPVTIIAKLKTNWRQKLALGLVFCLGGFMIVFSIVRVTVSNNVDQHPELTWLALWSNIEASVAVIMVCLLTFRHLFAERNKPSHQSPQDRYKAKNAGSKTIGSQPTRETPQNQSSFERLHSNSSMSEHLRNSRGLYDDGIELRDTSRSPDSSNNKVDGTEAWPLAQDYAKMTAR